MYYQEATKLNDMSSFYSYSYCGKELKFEDIILIENLQDKYREKYIIFLYDLTIKKCIILNSYDKATPDIEIKRREYIKNNIPVHTIKVGESNGGIL